MKVDDKKSLSQIKKYIKDKEILLLFPGRSILEYKDKIEKFIKEHNPVVIPINFTSRFLPECNCLPFFGSAKRYKKFIKKDNKERCIVVSNILDHRNEDYVVNYESLIDRDNDNFDSSSIMILNLLNLSFYVFLSKLDLELYFGNYYYKYKVFYCVFCFRCGFYYP